MAAASSRLSCPVPSALMAAPDLPTASAAFTVSRFTDSFLATFVTDRCFGPAQARYRPQDQLLIQRGGAAADGAGMQVGAARLQVWRALDRFAGTRRPRCGWVFGGSGVFLPAARVNLKCLTSFVTYACSARPGAQQSLSRRRPASRQMVCRQVGLPLTSWGSRPNGCARSYSSPAPDRSSVSCTGGCLPPGRRRPGSAGHCAAVSG